MNLKKIILIVFFSQLFFSCKDLIEQDLSNERIVIVSPTDSTVINNYSVLFWWNENKMAQKYRIQIVQPSFQNIQKLLLDTLVTDIKVMFNLFPGSYQWRVKGENPNSSSAYTTCSLKIDTSSDLTDRYFFVNTPTDNYCTNSTSINFTWQLFPYANYYEYNLLDSTNNVIKVKTIVGSQILDSLNYEGKFYWKVRALNTVNSTYSNFSAARSVLYDKTPPIASVQSFPVNKDSVLGSVELRWTRGADTYVDSLFVSTDSMFQTFTVYRLINSNKLILPNTIQGTTYFWRIRSVDYCNNISGYGPVFRFYIQ